jgi:DNA excision repair protein ERCC-3
MSPSGSPASSLDFANSSGGSGSEEEYQPVRRRQAPTKRAAAVAGKKGKKGKATQPIKINLSALRRAAAVTSAHPAEGDIEEDEPGEGEYADGLIGARGVDLSGLELKADHAARPLWVDEHGNMYAISSDWKT